MLKKQALPAPWEPQPTALTCVLRASSRGSSEFPGLCWVLAVVPATHGERPVPQSASPGAVVGTLCMSGK